MATSIVKEIREPLHTNPTGNFTLKRGEHKRAETLKLLSHHATWLSRVTGVPVGQDTVCEDLLNGVCLCKLMSLIPGSGVTKFHEVPTAKGVPMDSWKSKENMAQFQAASAKLKLPVVFGTAELEQQNLFQVASALLFLVHTASMQGVGVQELKDDAELTERVRAVTEATVGMGASDAEGKAAADMLPPVAEAGALSWWQQLLVRFGFGDWIDSLDPEKLREYAVQLRQRLEDRAQQMQADAREAQANLSDRVLKQTASFKEQAMSLRENLPESLKSRISS